MNLLRLFSLVLILICFGCKTEEKKPNIILIMTDDLGWYDVGFNGNKEIKTPALDKLARQGLIFDRFYSASTVCSPTRASVLTGRHPNRVKIYGANTGHLPKEELTLAEILKTKGYSTGHFGKWHLGTLTKNELDANRGGRAKFDYHFTIPTEHGFDEYFTTESKVPTYDPMVVPDSFQIEESLRYGWKSVTNDRSIKNYGTHYWTGENQKVMDGLEGDDSKVIMDRVIPFIEKSSKNRNPFFTTIWFHTPHLPLVADSIHRNMFSEYNLEKQLYYGTIKAMDEQIDRLWGNLVEQGIEEETIIFFCSDNGPERETPGTAGRFKGEKRDLYEGGVRVPAFVVWKNNIDNNQRTFYPTLTSDYLPTILDILEVDYNADHPLDGISIWDAIQNKEIKRSSGIGFIYGKKKSWVTDNYKLITANGDDYELYNLIEDPSESNNIINDHPNMVTQMKTELDNWLKSVEKSEKGFDY
jgi:arylsulfatase A-like enzyme